MAGLTISAYVRRQLVGEEPEATARFAREAQNQRRAEKQAPGDLEVLTAQFARTMPRRNAESLAKRELQRRQSRSG